MNTEQLMNIAVAALGGMPAPLIAYGVKQIPTVNEWVKDYEPITGAVLGFLILFLLGYFTESDIVQSASFGAAGVLGAEMANQIVLPMLEKVV